MAIKTTKDTAVKVILDARVLEKIKTVLENKSLKSVYVARALGYSDSWASQHMGKNRDRDLSVNQLLKIAEILNVHPGSLLPGENPGKLPTFEEYLKSIIDEHTKDEARKIFKEEIENYFKNKK